MSFVSPKGTHRLNLMRYHGASIENTYYHQPSSIVTQSIGIYDHFKVSSIGESFLLILAQVQYYLNLERRCTSLPLASLWEVT